MVRAHGRRAGIYAVEELEAGLVDADDLNLASVTDIYDGASAVDRLKVALDTQANGSQIWSHSVSGLTSIVAASPTVVDGVVYFGSDGNGLHAVNARDGTGIWTFFPSSGTTFRSSPVVSNGMVYAGARDNNLYAVDAADGTQVWSFSTGGDVDSSPTVVDGIVYVGSGDATLYAVNAADGSLVWSLANASGLSSPTVVDGVVYSGTDDNSLDAVNAADGSLKWSFGIGNWIASSPTVVDGTVYAGSDDGNVYAVSASDGTEEWSFNTGNWVRAGPAVVDGVVYAGSDSGSLYALNAADGSEIWSFATGNWVRSAPIVVDGVVYFGDDGGDLFALDAFDGSQIWTTNLGQIRTAPTVDNGIVYTGGGGALYAIDAVDRFARLYVGDSLGWVPLHRGPGEPPSPAASTRSGNHHVDPDQTLGVAFENRGTVADAIDTNTASVQSVTVTHGLAVAPQAADIRAIPTNGPNNGESMSVVQVRSIGSANFVVDVEVTSTSGGSGESADLSWQVDIGR